MHLKLLQSNSFSFATFWHSSQLWSPQS